ncbi:BACON domain-containing protein [Duganella sp. LjRoot269]|uniref:BACON domain-containing protein n=1 Tax=Duganella sp. LjRoot269 TaxID=3342305 RepID=UPI003ECC7F16
MLRPKSATVIASLTLAALLGAGLTACGGGGGGGGGGGNNGGGTDTPAASPALTFNPATVRATINAGTSLTLNVLATVNRPADFANATTVVASVTDSAGVIQPSAQLIRDSDTQYHAILQSAPGLAAGTYTGNFNVRLCRDSGCASQFPGSPMLLPYSFQVVPAGQATFTATPTVALAGTAHLGGAAPAAIDVAIAGEGRSWTVASGAGWLKPARASGTGSGTLNVVFDTTGLALGSYNTTLTITASDGQVASLPASLTVLPSGLTTGANGVTFTAVNGAPIPTQVVSIGTDDNSAASWSAVSNAPWLRLSPTSGGTPSTTVLTVDPTVGSLASASYNSSITLSAPGLSTRALPVALNLVPATLTTSANSLTLGGTYGRDFSTSQTLTLSLNTSTNSWPWSLDGMPSWASATVASGSINQGGTSTVITARPANAAVGTTSVLVKAASRVNGDLAIAPTLLTINKDQHKLIPSETAVAFSASPSWTRLTRTLTVTDNFNNFTGMSASSSATWLVAGVNGNKLVLTADPTPFGPDTLNIATVTLTPNDADAKAPEPIRVALWKGTLTPTANVTLPLPYATVIADPIRPYAYAHNGGAYIDVYNLYSGQKVITITGLAASLGDMVTSANGDVLHVLNLSNHALTSIDLNTFAVLSQLPLTGVDKTTRLKIIRPNGVEVLVLGDGRAYLTAGGVYQGTLPLTAGVIAASGDGKLVVQQQENTSAVQVTSVSVDYASLGGGMLYPARIPAASHSGGGALGQDIAVSADGTRIYSASATPKLCAIASPADLGVLGYLAAGDGTPNNVELGSDGRIYCGAATRATVSDVWVYDTTGKLLNQFKLAAGAKQLLPRQMAVSGDGLLLIGITDDGATTIVPVGP